jgi:dCMP deaminase
MEKTNKRQDYIEWDEYFMNIAKLSARRSKDPNTQVGACIVNDDNKIIGIGYNGLPRGMNDDDLDWSRKGDYLNTKYPYVCHAEMNAILNSVNILSLKNTTIYVTLFPCNECSKLIVQSGIKKVVYLEHKYEGEPVFIASQQILTDGGRSFARR